MRQNLRFVKDDDRRDVQIGCTAEMNYQTHNDGQNNQRHITVAANHRSYNHRSHDNAKERNKIVIYKKENTKDPTPEIEKIHTSKKQCIREDPTQLLADDNVHTGRKRSNKRRTRKTKKNICLLTYLLTSHCDSNKDAILFPFPALVTHCYCANSYFAAADLPQALHQRDGQGGTRTHAWCSSSEDKEGCASRRTIEPRHQHYYYFFFFFFFSSLFSLLELFSASTSLVCVGLVSSRTPHAPL
jgi:hypothetical protein